MKKGAVKIVRGFKTTSEKGSHFRLICLTGKNKGTSYFLKGDIVILGRSDDADIYVEDTKSSRKHLELKKVDGGYIATDLGSQNGVIINNLQIIQQPLKSEDKIVIGRTVYKYDHFYNEAEKKPSNSNRRTQKENLNNASIKKKAQRRIFIIACAFFLIYLFSQEEAKRPSSFPVKKTNPNRSKKGDDFVTKLKRKKKRERDERSKKIEIILKRGLREYREGNYFRAMYEFNLALIADPESSRALFYRSKSQQRLQEEIEVHLKNGQLEMDANKYSSAKQSYCMIIRLLKNYPQDQNRINAQEKIKEIEVQLGLPPGSIKCLRTIEAPKGP